MKITESFRRFIATITLGILIITNLNPLSAFALIGNNKGTKIIYPLKEISKLDCRFEVFSSLSSNCKQSLPILHTKDYEKYTTKNGGYNDYTRIYTVLWGSSYKYGWDVGNGGHLGVDIVTAKGTPVYNITNGIVIKAKKDLMLGNYISIQHTIRGKKVVSTYAHMSKLFVTKGQIVGAGYNIGLVGSTGNSTGNHLHFQIDIESPFYPYYYDYSSCPYSYKKISSTGICFNEMKKHTIDPMLFLETSGKVLDNIEITTKTINLSRYKSTTKHIKRSKNIKRYKDKLNGFDMSIFSRTVYKGYNKNDIKKVQQIFKDLGKYRGKINANYSDIENVIISYQISNNIVKNKTSLGAGWFGPKTRSRVKFDYNKFLTKGGKPGKTYYIKNKSSSKTSVSVKNNIQIKKISKRGLLSRAEIEARDINKFFNKYNINLKLNNIGGNIQVGTTSILNLKITDKRGRLFKGNIPGGMTFGINTNKIKIFPTKLYYFTNGQRNIKLTGVKVGSTKLNVKIGKKVIKSINLNIYKPGKAVYPETGMIYSNSNIVLSDNKTAIVLFRDKNGRKLINYKYGSSYIIKGSRDVNICIKSGNLKNIKKIYKSKCSENNYKKEIKFNYSDTVAGLLLFDYKATGKDVNIKILNNYNKKVLATKKIIVSNPKGLKNTYAYKNEIIKMLESGVVDGINKGYFLEKRGLVASDGIAWIKNTLNILKKDSFDPNIKNNIDNNLSLIEKERVSRFNTITRNDFLDLVYKYLVFNKSSNSSSMNYRDLNSSGNNKISSIFDKNNTWKDQFGKNYYRPNKKITRGEGAYFLTKIINKNKTTFLARK